MKNFKLDIKKTGCEVLVLTLSAEKEDGTRVSKDIDLGGNATGACKYGAFKVVDALNSL